MVGLFIGTIKLPATLYYLTQLIKYKTKISKPQSLLGFTDFY